MANDVAKLSFWGVRGSTPTVDRAMLRYGGNTPCLELITPDGGRLILDCGTGLRILGNRLAAAADKSTIEAEILVTHYHWDHIQGIPFFAPLYSSQNKFHFYSFRSEFLGRESLKRVFEAQMAHPYFPVNLQAMSAVLDFTDVAGGLFSHRKNARPNLLAQSSAGLPGISNRDFRGYDCLCHR
jgi:phosphoribosyl 1,2-cyclic phosphodiesterase